MVPRTKSKPQRPAPRPAMPVAAGAAPTGAMSALLAGTGSVVGGGLATALPQPVYGPPTKKQAEKAKKAEMKQIREQRKAEAEADRKLRGTPYGEAGNERAGVREKLKHGAYTVGNLAAAPVRGAVESHEKAVDDLNLNRQAYKGLSRGRRFLHTLQNPLAHMRAGEKTLSDSVRRHTQASILPQIEAYGVQLEQGASAYSGRGVVDLKHVDRGELDAREEERREWMRVAYMQEQALGAANPVSEPGKVKVRTPKQAAPSTPEQRAAATEAGSAQTLARLTAEAEASAAGFEAGSAESKQLAKIAGRAGDITHVNRPNMAGAGSGPVVGTDPLELTETVAGAVGTVGEQAGGLSEKLDTAKKTVGLNLGGFHRAMGAASPFLGAAGGAGGVVGDFAGYAQNVGRLLDRREQGDTAGAWQAGFGAAGKVTSAMGHAVGGALGFVPGGDKVAGPAGNVIGLFGDAAQIGEGMAQGVQGSLTARHSASLMDEREYAARHGQAVSQREKAVLKSAAQMRRQADVEQVAGYTKVASGGLSAAGNAASLIPGAGPVPGAVLGALSSGVDFVGGKIAEGKLEDVQHTVANQEVGLDRAVNDRLQAKYGQDRWHRMSGRERDEAREKEEKVLMYYHGQAQGDLEQFTVEESQTRARGLTEAAATDTEEGHLAEQLITGAGLKKMKDGAYSEQAVGRRLYSRDGMDLDEAHAQREVELGSGIQHSLRQQEAKKAAKEAKKQKKAAEKAAKARAKAAKQAAKAAKKKGTATP